MKCALCGREEELNFHHLIPRTVHINKWFRKHFNQDKMNEGIMICRKFCHKEIHILIPEKEMGKFYNTIKLLLKHEKVRKYINWIKDRNL